MPSTSLALPPLDLLAHNLVALLIAIVLVMIASEIVVRAIFRISQLLLQASVFKDVSAEDREAMRRRVRRRTLIVVGVLSLGMLAAALVASYVGVRAGDVVRGAWGRVRQEDFTSLRTGALAAAGIGVAALIADAMVRSIVTALSDGLARVAWFKSLKEPLLDVAARLRTALRVVILGSALVLITRNLGLAGWVERAASIGTYALGALYWSRFIVGVAYIAIDLLFESSGKLTRLESPLRYLGSLTHLAPITKRAVDYFVFVGAATLVADELTPGTWISRVGRIGIRIIAIFYTSRVVVELCALFLQEIFLTRVKEGDEAGLQQRQTLVPVAVGLLRYGIYFSAVVMVLREVDIDPTPLLAGAGVIGVAIGLGAQAFVGDIVAGFFILFENLILVGDLVEVSHVKGNVEEIGVRITKIRDDAGVLHAIPNGEVRKVANHSKAFVNAIVDVFIPYEEDLRAVRELLLSLAKAKLEEETGRPGVVEVKVQELAEGAILLRVIARVPPGKDEDIGDVIRAHVAEELRSAGIGAPRPRRAVLIDSALRVGAPVAKDEAEEDEEPPKLFEPPKASD
jgi:small conductance mechanosensitive channel